MSIEIHLARKKWVWNNDRKLLWTQQRCSSKTHFHHLTLYRACLQFLQFLRHIRNMKLNQGKTSIDAWTLQDFRILWNALCSYKKIHDKYVNQSKLMVFFLQNTHLNFFFLFWSLQCFLSILILKLDVLTTSIYALRIGPFEKSTNNEGLSNLIMCMK